MPVVVKSEEFSVHRVFYRAGTLAQPSKTFKIAKTKLIKVIFKNVWPIIPTFVKLRYQKLTILS